MRDGAERRRAVAQGDPQRDRRQPAPPRHGLRRPLPDPPLGPTDADRGDAGGAARRRQGRQGPLHRRLVDVRLAVRQGAVRRRAPRLDAVRLDAEPLQPAVPRGGAGDAAAVRRPGRRRDPVEPAGPRPPDPRLGRDDRRAARPTSSARRSTATTTRAIVDAVADGRRAPRRQPRPRSRWPGCSRHPAVDAPIIGATKPEHLDDAVASLGARADRRRGRRARAALHAAAPIAGFA